MSKIKSLLALSALLIAVSSASAGVKVIGTLPNGDKIVRIKTLGVFAPATTTVLVVGKSSGDVTTLNAAGGPGVLPAVANAGGLVGAATVLRPARSNTNVQQSGGGANAVGNGGGASANAAGGAGGNANAVSVSGSSSTSTGGGNQNGSIHHNN